MVIKSWISFCIFAVFPTKANPDKNPNLYDYRSSRCYLRLPQYPTLKPNIISIVKVQIGEIV